METHPIQQEILLMISNTFSQKQLSKRDSIESEKLQSQAERLEEACWHGLLNQVLPEIIEKRRKLFLWNVRQGETFLQLNIGEYPLLVEKAFSIDANLLLSNRYN